MKRQRTGFMTANVSPRQTMSFKARSLLAFVLEPTGPVSEWLGALDAWLARSPAFFASKPVILEMAGLKIGLEEYRELLNDLALRHIRVMAVENPSRTLVGPELPPRVTGGRPAGSLAVGGGRRDPGRRLEEDADHDLADHRRQRSLRPVDPASRRRRDGNRPGRIGRRDRRRRIGPYLWRAARSRDRRRLGSAGSAHLLQGGASRAALRRRLLSHRRRHGPQIRGSQHRRQSGRRQTRDSNSELSLRRDEHEQGHRGDLRKRRRGQNYLDRLDRRCAGADRPARLRR